MQVCLLKANSGYKLSAVCATADLLSKDCQDHMARIADKPQTNWISEQAKRKASARDPIM